MENIFIFEERYTSPDRIHCREST